jgi:hypothetical protein
MTSVLKEVKMTNALRSVILPSSAALGLVFLTGSCRHVYHPLQLPTAEALIVLYADGSACKAELRPKYIVREPGQKVEWDVRNTCPGAPRTVRVRDFTHEGKGKNPFNEPEGQLVVTVSSGQRDTIRAHIKPTSDVEGRYQYKAYMGEVEIDDPDLEIWH